MKFLVKKIYDYNPSKVRSKLVSTLRRKKRAVTVADLTADTGLPIHQIKETIKKISDEYRGHLKVTETGDILYYFPNGLRRKREGVLFRISKFFRKILAAGVKVLSFLFKIWIMIMLVGYFLLFVAILVLAVVASIAASAAGRGSSQRSRGGGIFSFYLVMRVFQMFMWIWFFSGSGSYTQKRRRSTGRPLHKSIFAFVFGESDPNINWDEKERTSLIKYIRSRKGVITLDELMVISGKTTGDSEELMNRLLVEYEGEPGVTEEGSLIYLFPDLLRSGEEQPQKLPLLTSEKKILIPFNSNEKKTNRWISFFGIFNTVFSFYFLILGTTDPRPVYRLVRGVKQLNIDVAFVYYKLHEFLSRLGAQTIPLVITVSLGVIPLLFSVFFFLIPLVRRWWEKRKNRTVKQENMRRKIVFHVMANTDSVKPGEIRPDSIDETPDNEAVFVEKELNKLLAAKSGEVEQEEDGTYRYRFPEWERQLRDVENYRRKIDTEHFRPGKTVFDTGKN